MDYVDSIHLTERRQAEFHSISDCGRALSIPLTVWIVRIEALRSDMGGCGNRAKLARGGAELQGGAGDGCCCISEIRGLKEVRLCGSQIQQSRLFAQSRIFGRSIKGLFLLLPASLEFLPVALRATGRVANNTCWNLVGHSTMPAETLFAVSSCAWYTKQWVRKHMICVHSTKK